MNNLNIFKPGDSVTYKGGMDFKDFTGTVESCIPYKDVYHYMVKDVRDNSIKRVGERFLTSTKAPAQMKNKFNVGDSVSYLIDSKKFVGVIERTIQNYLGQWQYIVKDSPNTVKRMDEKNLHLNTLQPLISRR